MLFANHHNMVEAFPSNRADHPLRIRVLPWRAWRNDNFPDERITYNSCRNRHCPKCQRVATEGWLTARRAEVLPIPYFHVVFTLPHALNPLAQSHPRLLYRLLFQAAASTLTRFGRDPRHLGGELGVSAVLHTWG
jgi:hypothetical protein